MTTSDTAPRVRFAPSPTGHLHVGSARVALFNWLYARHTGGKFLLRVEDTDIERSTEESTQQILDAMEWLGMQPDEEIEYQSRRAHIHREYIQKLLASRAAYKCYCSKERLEELRGKAKQEGRTTVYDKRCERDAEWVAKHEAEGASSVVRFSVPESGVTVLDDMVYGYIEFDNAQIGDFVIARPDGSPVYNFTNAVDDIDMRITHICRGEDHVSNTPKQILIYHALGAAPPRFAHLPLVLGQDKTKLSKRHGATSVMQFRDQGILPEALVNFIALLGWAPEGGNEEVMPLNELIARFGLDKVNKSPAVFDHEKLMWMNGVYLRTIGRQRVYDLVLPLLKEKFGTAVEEKPTEWLQGVIDLQVERSRSLNDFAEGLDFFFIRPTTYEEKGSKKHLGTPEQVEQLRESADVLMKGWDSLPAEQQTDRTAFGAHIDQQMRAWAEQRGIKFGNAVHPIRIAVTGRTASPGLFDVMYYLGKEEVRARIDATVKNFSA